MHPLCDAIDALVAEFQFCNFGKPSLVLPTWEDGACLMIRSNIPLDAATPISTKAGEDDMLCFVLNKTLIMFPTRDASRSVSNEIFGRVNGAK